VGTEVVTLCLEKVGGNNLAAIAVKEGESGAERRSRDTPEDSLGNDTPPSGLSFVDGCKIF
jgi:hypothetical protein